MKNKPVTIAVIADIHYGVACRVSNRRYEIADLLLMRTVRRLNQLIRPDVTLVLGDLVDDGASPDVEKNLQHLRSILDKLRSPYIAIPGNHDNDPDAFYRVFDRPNDIEDIAGVRFLSFLDEKAPGCNAQRNNHDLERIRLARVDYDGPLVSLQHVCLHPPGPDETPYNYTNADEVIRVMQETGVTLSISGHHHDGALNIQAGDVMFINAPGLCEAPFPFLEVTLEDDAIQTRQHQLVMPMSLKLHDTHVHTQLAYCSENMEVGQVIRLAKEFGLAGVTFTEHSGHLYFDRTAYWSSKWLLNGMLDADKANNRMDDYLALKEAYQDEYARFGLEADIDARGELLLKPEDRQSFDTLIGAVHALPGLTREIPPQASDQDDFLFLVEALCKQGVRSLAHPMRIFSRAGWPAPEELFAPTAQLLRKYQVAMEINFHTNQPPVAFIQACLHADVKFTFGSDSHNLYELGDFAYHLALLKEAGFDGDLSDVLLSNNKKG